LAKIVLQGYIIVPDSDIAAVKSELVNHIALTKRENGCLVFNVTKDSNNPMRFNVYEEFSDKHAFAKHQDRVRQSKWGAITVNVERHFEVTEVE
jgi:(4S)-4-hydroxy-5-phosphonooxypentane-2,3-dione isomerase